MCLKTCLDAFAGNIKRQAVSLPVGSGKTIVFSNLISRLPPPTPTATKTLVLAHREELLEQASRMIERVNPELRVIIDQGRSIADPQSADVVVASVPSLGRRNSSRLSKYDPSQFKCIIIDEAHHAAADSYLRILNHFEILNSDSPILLWGCSATLSRNDRLALGTVFEKIVFHIDILQLMKEGFLCPLKTVQVETDVDISHVSDASCDYDVDELSLAIDTPKRNQLIVDSWKQVAFTEHARRSTIVFGLNIKHVENLAQTFHQLNLITPAVITGNTSDVVRREIIELFEAGKVEVLLNCAVLTEGTDLPRTDCVLLSRPTCSPNLYIQMVGRGLRRHSEKEYCLLLDVIDKNTKSSRTLITFPTLLPKYTYNVDKECGAGDATCDVKRAKRTHSEIVLDKIKIRLSSCSSLEGRVNLGGHCVSWIQVNNHTFIASDNKSTKIELRIDSVTDDGFPCSITMIDSRDMRSVVAPSGTPLHIALEGLSRNLIDSRLLNHFSRDAPWKRYPITANQLKFVVGIARKMKAPYVVREQLFDWNIGRANELITKYVYLRNSGALPNSWEALVEGLASTTFIRPIRKTNKSL